MDAIGTDSSIGFIRKLRDEQKKSLSEDTFETYEIMLRYGLKPWRPVSFGVSNILTPSGGHEVTEWERGRKKIKHVWENHPNQNVSPYVRCELGSSNRFIKSSRFRWMYMFGNVGRHWSVYLPVLFRLFFFWARLPFVFFSALKFWKRGYKHVRASLFTLKRRLEVKKEMTWTIVKMEAKYRWARFVAGWRNQD